MQAINMADSKKLSFLWQAAAASECLCQLSLIGYIE